MGVRQLCKFLLPGPLAYSSKVRVRVRARARVRVRARARVRVRVRVRVRARVRVRVRVRASRRRFSSRSVTKRCSRSASTRSRSCSG